MVITAGTAPRAPRASGASQETRPPQAAPSFPPNNPRALTERSSRTRGQSVTGLQTISVEAVDPDWIPSDPAPLGQSRRDEVPSFIWALGTSTLQRE